MLRTVLIVSASGLVLFSREFANAVSQPRLVGSLVRTMIEFSTKSVGIPVSHIELAHVGVSIVQDDTTSLVCVLFYDRIDGPEFGRLIAWDILHAFIRDYSRDLRSSVGHNLREFLGFQYKLMDIVTHAIRPLLAQAQAVRGVHKTLLVTDDSKMFSLVDVDQLAVLANLQAFLAVLTDTMDLVGDTPSRMVLESSTATRTFLWRMTRATFLVQCQRSSKLDAELARCVHLLHRVCMWIVQLGAAR